MNKKSQRENAFKAAAIREIRERRLAVTRQLLGNQTLARYGAEPSIAGIVEEEEKHSAAVYFPVENEDYFFAVYLDTDPEASLRFTGMVPGCRVYGRIGSETRNLSELLSLFPLEACEQWQKGDPISNRSSARCLFSGMTIEPDQRMYVEPEAKLDGLLDVLERYPEHFPPADDFFVHIQIAYYGYREQMSGIHLSAKAMSRLAALGLELDIDLHAGGPDLFAEP
ncbi:DUF4279 domain-containing protein [Saccharibacillus deserti]|uniref:DUF4279 domain-containing protein n=1 Tax=Saccharibacillus deserti TaxID=1634444 RepID=UPI001557368D|nr:DUF4279 domain-containing protein [Saccharibacillus deserti]